MDASVQGRAALRSRFTLPYASHSRMGQVHQRFPWGRKMGQRHMRLLNRKNLSNLGEFIEPYGREISLASRSGKDQIEQMVSLKNKTAIL